MLLQRHTNVMTSSPKKSPKALLNKTSQVTSHDVARLAGVSQSVVSRAFSLNGKIAPATRQRVLSAARTLGYQPNAFARSLVQQRTGIVGILIARLDNHLYPQVLEELTAGLWEAERQTMYFNVDEGGNIDKVLRTALQYRVEAMIMASITLSSHMAKTLYEAGVPVVLFNRRLDDPNVNAVACDNEGGGRLVAERLLNAGHDRFAFIGGHPDTSTNQDRKGGFIAGLRARGAGLEIALEKDYSYAWGQSAVRGLFAQSKPPDALFCAGDLIALGAIDALRGELGLRVPEDVSVVGFDDVKAASWDAYKLSTVRQPLDQMIAETLALVTDTQEDPTPKRITVPVTLVERSTVRPVALEPLTS
jgi:DNA-binding LacI/PurR family transcriptional regulator